MRVRFATPNLTELTTNIGGKKNEEATLAELSIVYSLACLAPSLKVVNDV
jgi:hypothetical protein